MTLGAAARSHAKLRAFGSLRDNSRRRGCASCFNAGPQGVTIVPFVAIVQVVVVSPLSYGAQ